MERTEWEKERAYQLSWQGVSDDFISDEQNRDREVLRWKEQQGLI